MPKRTYRTSDLARAVGIHPNTVMRYIEWGLIPPVERTPAGYRIYTQLHLDCLRLARLIYSLPYTDRELHSSAHDIIEAAAADDWINALDLAQRFSGKIRQEINLAEGTVALLQEWATRPPASTGPYYSIGKACERLDVTRDVLRNWERNGLISIPRSPQNGYRQIGTAEMSRLRIIRSLSHAGYSMMAMLRMFTELDSGNTSNLRETLDTPRPDEDVYMAADRWLTTLYHHLDASGAIFRFIEDILQRGPL